MSKPDWGVKFSAHCPAIAGDGFACMVCAQPAVGHAVVKAGQHDGRPLAVLCARHASAEGWAEFTAALAGWAGAGLLALDGGPGPGGAPEVLHRDHWDPLPTCEEEWS